MGYLDALTNSSFKRVNDHWEFFPCTFGLGYKIPTAAQYCVIRGFVRRYLLVSTALIILVGLVIGWPISVALWPMLFLFYLLSVWRVTRNLARSSERLTLQESFRLQVMSHSASMLWRLEIASLLCLVLGVTIFVLSPQNRPIALLDIVIFGTYVIIVGRMIRKKWTGTARGSREDTSL